MMNKEIIQLREDIRLLNERHNDMRKSAYSNFQKVLTIDDGDMVYISWEQLKALNIDERVKVDDVEFLKLREGSNEMVFNTMMVEGGKFQVHFHDCVEICTVLEGRMIETRKGSRLTTQIYNVGERAIYDKGEEHALHVNEYTLLEVRFIKNL